MAKITIFLVVFFSFASPIRAEEDAARAIVKKAIEAQGGEAKTAKLQTMRIKAEGTAVLIPGQPPYPVHN